MDTQRILNELKTERSRLDHVIAAVETVVRGGGKRRGRPPAWMKSAATPAQPKKKEKAR